MKCLSRWPTGSGNKHQQAAGSVPPPLLARDNSSKAPFVKNAIGAVFLTIPLALVAMQSALAGGKGAEIAAADWPGYGRTLDELHFSPLTQINDRSVEKLGLAWSFDLPAANPVSAPIAMNGIIYTSTGYSVVRAIDATSGRVLWTFDPEAADAAGEKLRMNWGSRGLAWWNGRIYVATADGRLIALDAKTGKPVWNVLTVGKDDGRTVTGAPRIYDGKVLIGHGGADTSPIRGYVTAYDANDGRQLWRFHTVPGNPADGFENDAMEMASKTWSGEWWKHGGGGTAWNSFAYDAELKTIYIGTGNGAPWNHRVRSDGKGDNLFLCSVIALDAETGKYKWHYQFNPGETWDYNAAMDIHLATLTIAGKPRKVLIEAPKNGFVYVIDRITGAFISADPIARVTWASGIDPVSGRPIENPEARYGNGSTFDLWPSPHGAHTWLPSAFDPTRNLVYIPVRDSSYSFSDKGIDLKRWQHPAHVEWASAVNVARAGSAGSYLLAWDPVKRQAAWKVPTPALWNGGVLATGGGLVFQGQSAGKFIAYAATTGKALWSFDAQVPVLAPPITFTAKGRQYVTVLAGTGTTAGISAGDLAMPVDYHTQPRRILTFALGGKAKVSKPTAPMPVVADPAYQVDAPAMERGGALFGKRCFSCHGLPGRSGGTAPDLARSGVPVDADAFDAIIRSGALVSNGMPRFAELSDSELADIRQFIRAMVAQVPRPDAVER